MDKNICRRQFTCRSFGFRCKEEEKNLFYKLQWSENRVIYLAYRLFMCLYSLGWLLAHYIVSATWRPWDLQREYRFFTRWGEWISAIYFALAFALSVVGVIRRNRSNRMEHGSIKFLRSASWMCFSFASMQQTVILIMYWSALAPHYSTERLTTPFNIHEHAVTCVMIFIEIFASAFPIRIFHSIYAMAGGAIYILMTVVLYALDSTDVIYPFLNWKEKPGLAAGVSIGLCIPGTILIQSVFFGLYCLRLVIHKSFCGGSAVSPRRISTLSRSSGDVGSENPAYTSNVPEKYQPQASDYF